MIRLDNFRDGFINKHPYNTVSGHIADYTDRFSQNGEEGVLEKIFNTLGVEKGTFINGGCDDINDHSNVRRLISFFGWNGLFIEPNTPWLDQGIKNIEKDYRIKNKDVFQYHNGYLSVNKEEEMLSNVIKEYYVDEG